MRQRSYRGALRPVSATVRAGLWSVASLLAACSSPVLDRLAGEPEVVAPLTQPVTNRTHPAVSGCQRFVLAVQRGQHDAAYAQLSDETRMALTTRAASMGLRGVDLLRLGKLPVPAPPAATDAPAEAPPTVALEPLRLFAVPQIKTLQVLATPESDRFVEQLVELTDASGTKRTVALRFENYDWRLHNPTLAYP